jgi:hypothetical protein
VKLRHLWRPSTRQAWRTIPLPLIGGALVFGFTQLYLMNLAASEAVAMTVVGIIAVAVIAVCGVAFFRNSAVRVTDDRRIAVVDWLGRERLTGSIDDLQVELVSVRTLGFTRHGAVLSIRGNGAVPLWRDVWGDEAIRGVVRSALEHSVMPEAISARALRKRYPGVHSENFAAIAGVVIFILALAVIISRH